MNTLPPQIKHAILVLILPFITEFLKTIEYPLTSPVEMNQVTGVTLLPGPSINVILALSNNVVVEYRNGVITRFDPYPKPYQQLSKRERKQASIRHLSTNEAISLARGVLTRLGHALPELYADLPPVILNSPEGKHLTPHYRIDWQTPHYDMTSVSMEINAVTKQIAGLLLMNYNTWRGRPGAPDLAPLLKPFLPKQSDEEAPARISEEASIRLKEEGLAAIKPFLGALPGGQCGPAATIERISSL